MLSWDWTTNAQLTIPSSGRDFTVVVTGSNTATTQNSKAEERGACRRDMGRKENRRRRVMRKKEKRRRVMGRKKKRRRAMGRKEKGYGKE